MFTGIVEEKGTVRRITRGRNSCALEVEGRRVLEDLRLGDSVAVNGVCLTVRELGPNTFEADVMGETLFRSTLGQLKLGSTVNLERAMAAGGRFGGHIVSGHIDGTGTIVSQTVDEIATWVKISAPPAIMYYLVEKGSIAIDGVSLTVAKLEKDSFQVSLIPHTGQETTLLERKVGEAVNLENDVIGKYVEKLLAADGIPAQQSWKASQPISREWLLEQGF
ncbi:riboflavin synthase [Aminipila butyrica]|uniref:Riboflavin synthase n=1 Tax=Aminipila butyrica TaxID=433296 RepID=A0A858C0B3_9FIRM|nr:riboflavin synthase [Aminipila butyrica]QIB69816.1 riboflavin synthase [Aminipila butyrica]